MVAKQRVDSGEASPSVGAAHREFNQRTTHVEASTDHFRTRVRLPAPPLFCNKIINLRRVANPGDGRCDASQTSAMVGSSREASRRCQIVDRVRCRAANPVRCVQQARNVAGEYFKLQLEILSRSDRSFNSIHDRTKRVETSHIHDGTWLTDELAVQRGLDIEDDPQTRALWHAAHQGFALCGWVSEQKFGPNRVVFRTPLSNIRITTFFAGEHEVRIIDPDRVELVAAIGCHMQWER